VRTEKRGRRASLAYNAVALAALLWLAACGIVWVLLLAMIV
jgi:hypothetical protein